MKEVICAVSAVFLGLAMFAATYDYIKPRIDSFTQGISFYYMQPFVDKYINKPEAHFDLNEKPKCVIFECLHKETL